MIDIRFNAIITDLELATVTLLLMRDYVQLANITFEGSDSYNMCDFPACFSSLQQSSTPFEIYIYTEFYQLLIQSSK
jgi:hypothetical protein